MGSQVEGDPAFRAAMNRLIETLTASPTGRYLVLLEDTTIQDPAFRYVGYGPFGKPEVVDKAAALRTDLHGQDGLQVHVVFWGSPADIR